MADDIVPQNPPPTISYSDIERELLNSKGKYCAVEAKGNESHFESALDQARQRAAYMRGPVAFIIEKNGRNGLYVTDSEGKCPETGQMVSIEHPNGVVDKLQLAMLKETNRTADSRFLISDTDALNIVSKDHPVILADMDFTEANQIAFIAKELPEEDRSRMLTAIRHIPNLALRFHIRELFGHMDDNLPPPAYGR